jgi:hypothetical protein
MDTTIDLRSKLVSAVRMVLTVPLGELGGRGACRTARPRTDLPFAAFNSSI